MVCPKDAPQVDFSVEKITWDENGLNAVYGVLSPDIYYDRDINAGFYGFNESGLFMYRRHDDRFYFPNRAKNPSGTVILADAKIANMMGMCYFSNDKSRGEKIAAKHGGRVNVAYIDGHVRSLSGREAYTETVNRVESYYDGNDAVVDNTL